MRVPGQPGVFNTPNTSTDTSNTNTGTSASHNSGLA